MKKVLSILLAAVMLFTMVPASVFAADGITVKLVSFMRGDVTDLRSSELLEVQVEGYDGNPRELTYKWTSSLGTYLYIYNSHNMYGINNTYGEYEIYNTDKDVKRNSNVESDRSGNKTLTKEGFMWASVYGAYTYGGGNASTALRGTVKVEVFDKNGKSLGSDSFSSFKAHNLDADLDNVVIGLFEGDRMNALDLLGQSGIVHITCEQSKVSSAVILEGKEHIEIETEKKNTNTYNYYIKGVKAGNNSDKGDAELDINITKSTCKFHYNTSGNAQPIVYVFKKPTTTTTTTTLILNKDSIDERCEYFIDGNKGEKQPDGTIVFTGLTPNTDYTVEVRAEYKDGDKTKYVYSYVDDTTKPVYSAKIYTYLDSALTDFENIYGSGAELLIREDNPYTEYISLGKTSTGVYEAPLYNAVFNPWIKLDGEYNKIGDYQLVIEHANAELHLHNYSVKYDTNGGAFKAGEEIGTEIYASGVAVNATSNVPVREGFIFTGWDYSGKTIASGNKVTASISAPVTLKAKWEKAVNVTINVIIDHNSNDGGFDQVETRADLDIDFLEMTAGSPAFVETGDRLHFTKDGVTDENGNIKAYDYNCAGNISTYTATAATYTGLLNSSTFGVALSKSDYDVGTIEKIKDENGNWTINVPLKHTPSNFDIEFSVEMADGTPPALYPDAVIVKVAFWNGTAWEIITQQASTDSVVKPGVRVDIDPTTGKGAGSYPVWIFANNNEAYGYRAVITGFVYGDSVITVPNEIIEGKIAAKTYTDGNYTATMGDVADGAKYGTEFNGAYYNGVDQQGTLHGVITVEQYDVTFDANGGEINGNNTYTEEDEYYVPDTKDFVPEFDGHEFDGWYKDPEFKEPVTDGEILKENVTFYAKWDQILTGNVRVAGSYMQDGKIVDVWAVDRADSAVIALKEITEDGAYIVDSQTVKIVWPMSEMIYGISEEYKFTGLDPEKTYRTEVLTLNYGTTYQNSTTTVVNDDNYADDYNTTDFTAIYPENSKWETFVNAYLSFEPASYFQPVEVDATLIGAALRPKDTLVQVWYKETSSQNAYQVISQHTVVPYGIEIAMGADGMDNGDYGYTVWNSVYNGNLYDYQAYLDKIESKEVSEWPVSVVYGSPSRYSPLNDAPTGVLQVKIIPNHYSIIYHENYEDEGVSVVSYGTHIWSYETVLDYTPAREGYVFEGWYSNPECIGEKVTKIAETVAEDTELYARWEKRTDLELKVNHIDKDTNEALATETKTAQTFGDIITAESLKKEFKGYSYDSASAENVTIGTETNEITLYYTKNSYGYTVNYLEEGTNKVLAEAKNETADYGTVVTEGAKVIDGYTLVGNDSESITIDTENNAINFYYAADNFGGGEDGDESDDIPDKYQKKVIFKVVNGTWSDGTAADKIVYLELMKDGKYAVDGTASLTAPTGMAANEGYNGGSWDVTPPAVVSGTDTETYIYSFEKRTDLALTVKHIVSGTGTVLGTEVKENLTFGDVITAESLKKEFDGYKYTSASDESVTISEGNNEIILYYSRNSYSYKVNYLEEGTNKPLTDTKILVALYGAEVTEEAISISKYAPVGETKKTITISSSENVINFYYATDKVGGGKDGDKSDGTPDKYQKKVIFKVVNGTWSDGTAADKVVYLDLMKYGEYAVDGTASLTAPTGMIANKGFDSGAWDVTPPSKVIGVAIETYTYYFEAKLPEDIIEVTDRVTVYEGDSTDIKVEIIPDEGADESEIPEVKSYESTDESIAIVDQNGKVTGVKKGTTTVIVTFTDGTQKTVVVVVKEREGIHVVFGKTEGIGWYRVSRDGGKTFETVFGNSTLEVKKGTQLIIKVGDLMGDTFVFYVNGDKVHPDDEGKLVVTVDSYMLIGALGYDFEVPDVDESLNWFQKIIKAIKDFFNKLFGWMK